MTTAYLDNSATTPVCPAAAARAAELMCQNFGNPSSVHSLGFAAEQALEAARQTVAGALSASPGEIVFTSGGTESNNLAVLGAALSARRRGDTVLTTAVEHPSVLQAVKALEGFGFHAVVLPVEKDGGLSLETVERALTERTVLVSVMLVNNETGARQPVEAIAALLKRKGSKALLHTDAVQAFGKQPLSVASLGVDLLSVSGHKIHAPKGVGALYVKKGVRLTPQTYGGGQEGGLRSGTQAVHQIGAFAAAVEALPPAGEAERAAEALRVRLLAGLATIPGAVCNSPPNASPFIVNLSVPGLPSEVLIRALEEQGVFVSGGSACAKGGRSHVLGAMGLPPALVDSALRVSFSTDTTPAAVDLFLSALQTVCRTLYRKGTK